MSAGRMPQAEESLLARPLGLATRLVLRFPRTVLTAAVAVALLAVLLTASQLNFHTSRLDLLNPESAYNKLWIEYINEFGDEDDVVIVVEGTDQEAVVPVLEELSTALARDDRRFHAVLHKVDLSRLRTKGLHYVSREELEQTERFLSQFDPVLSGDWSQLGLGKITGGINYRLGKLGERRDGTLPDETVPAAAEAELSCLADSLLAALSPGSAYLSPWPRIGRWSVSTDQFDSEYLLSNEGRLGFVLLRLSDTGQQFLRGSRAINDLRRLIARIQAKHPAILIGLTGLPVMETDEMCASQQDMLLASVVSLLGVACLFVAGFGGLQFPLLAVTALLLAMAWSFGYITLAVGHLNILSISFGVILIGLGIDFGIHFVARYLQVRPTMQHSDDALVQTATSIGPGIVTGGVTTAIAFFMAGLTDFTGIAELGIIAGGGILLCVVSALVVLPVMIYLAQRHQAASLTPDPLQVVWCIAPLMKLPRSIVIVAFLLTLAAAAGVRDLRYDHNLLNLQPIGLESVDLERKLLSETDESVWFALSIAETPEELLARKRRFLELSSVAGTEEIVSRLPADDERKREIIARVQRRLAILPRRPPLIPVIRPEKLRRLLADTENLLPVRGPSAGKIRAQLRQVRERLHRIPPTECFALLTDYQQRLADDLLGRFETLQSVANAQPPQLSDLPESLVTRFVGKHNRHLLKIYGRDDIWNMDALETFVRQIQSVDLKATGKPLQTYYASRQMQQSYIHAALYALVAVMTVLFLDFRSIRYSLLVLLPTALGMLQMFGLLGWLDIPLNPANMIVLPLVLGIGIDDGVHVVHDFRCQRGRYRLSSSTATAVLITSLTTMIGFGSLMIAGHQGLRSLGRVLTIGVSCCLFTSIVALPALLTWLTRNRQEPPDEEQLEASPDETSHPLEAADRKLAPSDPSHDDFDSHITEAGS